MMPAAAALGRGTLVAGRYELGPVVGTGMTGTIHEAWVRSGPLTGERVAAKLIHPRLLGDRQVLKRFHREARILSRVEGPHIVKLLDFVEEHELCIIVLEYVDGPSLEDYLRHRGPVAIEEALAIASQICAALGRIHAAGVIHRDLKPGNVLVEGLDDWRTTLAPGDLGAAADPTLDSAPPTFRHGLLVRVADFGLAKVLQGEGGATALTEQDMIFGTPDYMSPEQVAGEELDGRADLYALSAILYEMVVGRPPYDTPGALTTMAAHVNQPVPSPRAAAPERVIGPELEALIMRGLSKRREDRYASAEELRGALAALGAASEPPPPTAPDPHRISSGLPPSDDPAASLSSSETQALSSGDVGTTLRSEKDEALARARGAAVRVVVRESLPNDSSPPPATPAREDGWEQAAEDDQSLSRPDEQGGLRERHTEQRLWLVVAVLLAAVAVGVGIFLGAR
ncbi:MAG: serine/threonine protein kinase [Myxococcales bacterium]|nr:serine/threonine protein kinase [Myxococcales bacterium]